MRALLAIVALVCACSHEPVRVRPPLPSGAIEICEPCVGTIGDYRVGVGNIWERDLAGPDGVVAKRPSAVLAIWRSEGDAGPGDRVTVAVGSEFKVGEHTYRVIDIDIPPGKPGSVRLQKK